MLSSRNGRRRGAALVSAALLASLGFAASAVTIEQAPGAKVLAAGAEAIRLAQNAPAKVSYSIDQADRGENRYKKACVECHGEDLNGGMNGGAPLRGGRFVQNFGGAPASALFIFMSAMMPPDSPGRFSESVYADLMAYVLKRNGFQPGAALPSDVDALDNLVLEK
jgi:mono/diheme cytochrome c family protein